MVTRKSKKKRERVSASRRVAEHKSGGGGSKYLTLPDGFGFFAPKAGRYRLDFMSFVAGKTNPYATEGTPHYERTFWIHRDIGPNGEWHLCSAKTFGKPCPICEYRANLVRDPNADETIIKSLSPKERQLFLVINLDKPDEVLLWEYSFYLFGDILDKKIKYADEEDEYEYFADPEEGKTVRVNFAASDKGKWLDTTDIEFRDRRKQYDADKVDKMPCLDDLLKATPYDELKALFLQIEQDDKDDEDDEEPKKEKKTKKKPDSPTADDFGLEVGSTVTCQEVDDGDIDCKIIKISKDGTSLTLEDDDGDIHKAIGPGEVELVEKKKTKPKAKVDKEDNVDPDDDDDPEDDDEWDDDD